MEVLVWLIVFAILLWAAWHWFLAAWLEKRGFLGYLRGRKAATRIPDEVYYEQAADEIRKGQILKGLWAKAWSEAEGNENKAQALYIKLRVAAMKDEVARKVADDPTPASTDAAGKIMIACPRCDGNLRLPADKVLDVRCPKCMNEFRVDTNLPVTYLPFEDVSGQLVSRLGRFKFFFYSAGNLIAAIVLGVMVEKGEMPPGLPPWNWTTTAIILISVFYYILLVARIRDVGKSSWTAVYGAIPGLNLLLFLYLFVVPGMPGRNRYGPANDRVFM